MGEVQAEWLLVAVSYSIGSFPTAFLVGRHAGHDPTIEGSGNPGASNVYRVAGRRAGAAVLAGDLLKGMVATGMGLAVGGRPLGVACGAAAVVGHVFPLTRLGVGLGNGKTRNRGKGGKGVATAGGMGVVLYPPLVAAIAVVWAAIAAITRRPSVASLVAMAAVIPAVIVMGQPGWEVAVVSAISLLVLARHRGNVTRLLQGGELRVPSVQASNAPHVPDGLNASHGLRGEGRS